MKKTWESEKKKESNRGKERQNIFFYPWNNKKRNNFSQKINK